MIQMSKRVCMLLTDEELVDYRVVNEAKSLADAGYTVRLVMPSLRDADYTERVEGFEVCHVRPLAYSRRLLARLAVTRSWRKAFQLFSAAYDQQLAAQSSTRTTASTAAPPRATDTTTTDARGSSDEARGGSAVVSHEDEARETGGTLSRRLKNAVLDFCLDNPTLAGVLREYNLLLQEVAFAVSARQFRPDIVHAHDLQTLRLGRLLAEETGAKLVYDAHEFYPFQSFLGASARYWRRREEEDIRAPDVVITVNAFLARVMEEFYRVGNIRVIHNATPYRDFSSRRDSARAALVEGLSVPEGRFCVVLYVGNLTENRGLPELVEALALLPDEYLLAVLGGGPARADMERRVREAGLESRVGFRGLVPRERIPELAVGADVGFFYIRPNSLNDTYCSPNRFADYSIAGLPIVTPDLPFLRWFVETYGGGVLFDEGDPEDIARKIRQLFEDPARFDEFRRKSLHAGTQFNWDVESRKFLELYAGLG
jgi:glycosyltransferase involved in cell wall biosynthesis